MSKAGAPKENKNAEKWTLEEAEAFLLEAVDLSLARDPSLGSIK